MRRAVVFAIVISVGVVAWLLLDADPEGRAELWARITGVFTGGEATEPEPPNWGDVANKAGEFAEGNRALREVLNPEGAVAPTPTP